MKPVISVIIPTKNEATLLPSCLSSLVNQHTSLPYEIIVVDTNSTDGTKKIAKSFGVRLLSQPKRGKVYAFIKGAAHARGQILCFTEADCVLPPHWIETINGYIKKHPHTAAVTGAYTFTTSTPLYQFLVRVILPLSIMGFKLAFSHHSLRASNFAIRKHTYNNVGGFSQFVQEFYDVELSRRVKNIGTIDFLAPMQIKTSDRRVRGRLSKYAKEFFPSFVNSILLKKPILRPIYQDIR